MKAATTRARELTDWFPADVKPMWNGLYQTQMPGGSEMTWSIWNEGFWHYASEYVELSVRKADEGQRSFWQEREWRGLKEAA